MDGPPHSFPIKTLDDLDKRTYFDSPDFPFNVSSVPLQNGASSFERRPRLLACHDMQGGYVDDKWIQGSNNADAFTLTHWRLLDSFVYFSHNLVTLPPPCWTNAAHLHGVQVMGTFIIEGSEGRQICKDLLDTKDSAVKYADRLAELAQALGFDGWFINIESSVDSDKVDNLLEFVQELTTATHALVPQSLVIWYDSVTKNGNVSYQNKLDDKNKPFFDRCDGIFTNYWWTDNYPKDSAAAAGDRHFDVYMGVDVFGRGTYGGGGYQCDKALKAARDAGVSAALFGPGWAYENKEDEPKWWATIENCWPSARPDPVKLPFFTDFDIGLGRAKFILGKEVSDMPWDNISSQNLQPLLHIFPTGSSGAPLVVTLSKDDAVYSGGVSIKVVGDVGFDEVCVLQLYNAHEIIKEASLGISYSVFATSVSNVCLGLCAVDKSGAKTIFFLLDSKEKRMGSQSPSQQITQHISVVFLYSRRDDTSDPEQWSLREYVAQWGQFVLTQIFAVCSAAKNLKPLLIKLVLENETLFDEETFANPGMHDGSGRVGRLTSNEPARMAYTGAAGGTGAPVFPYSAQLGHVRIASAKHKHSFTFSDPDLVGDNPSWIIGGGGDNAFLSVNLRWKIAKISDKPEDWIRERYHVLVTNMADDQTNPLVYLGLASVGAFFVYMLAVPKQCPKVTFHLHRQCGCGEVQSSSVGIDCTLQVPWTELDN